MRLLKSLDLGSLTIGAGAVLLTPVVVSVVGSLLKSLTKEIIKGSLLAYEGIKVSIAETQESFENLAAEAKAEITQIRSKE
jgi:hypothetical protein